MEVIKEIHLHFIEEKGKMMMANKIICVIINLRVLKKKELEVIEDITKYYNQTEIKIIISYLMKAEMHQ